ncbi:hypothetical protein PSHT_05378, partial [Puccinia striiformis]
GKLSRFQYNYLQAAIHPLTPTELRGSNPLTNARRHFCSHAGTTMPSIPLTIRRVFVCALLVSGWHESQAQETCFKCHGTTTLVTRD